MEVARLLTKLDKEDLRIFINISKQEIETYNHYIEDQWNDIKRRLENQ